MPTSCKVVVFDSKMHVRKAFKALLESGHRSAPVWDSIRYNHLGMLTVSDFIDVVVDTHRYAYVLIYKSEKQALTTSGGDRFPGNLSIYIDSKSDRL